MIDVPTRIVLVGHGLDTLQFEGSFIGCCTCCSHTMTVVQRAWCVSTAGGHAGHALLQFGGTHMNDEVAEGTLHLCCCKISRLAATVVGEVAVVEVASQVGPSGHAAAANATAIMNVTGMVKPQPVHIVVAANPATQ